MPSFDPGRPDFAPYGFSCVRWMPTLMPRPDRHNEIELNLLKTGWIVYMLGGRKMRVEARRLTAFWAGIPHQIVAYSDEREYFVATLPLAWFIHCKLPDSLVQPLLHGMVASSPDTGRAHTDTKLFAGWETDLKTKSPEAPKVVQLEMEARLLRLALACPAWKAPRVAALNRRMTVSDSGLSKIEQMARLIAQHYHEPLTVEGIARRVGLQPNYAMTLFKKALGTTLIDYVTQHRVSHAQRLLVTSDIKVVDVAAEAGFGSLSRFNEAFHRACGCPPRDYRKKHLGSPPTT